MKLNINTETLRQDELDIMLKKLRERDVEFRGLVGTMKVGDILENDAEPTSLEQLNLKDTYAHIPAGALGLKYLALSGALFDEEHTFFQQPIRPAVRPANAVPVNVLTMLARVEREDMPNFQKLTKRQHAYIPAE